MSNSYALRFPMLSLTRAAAVVAVGLASLAASTPARAEVVSKLPGAGGLAFPAQFVDASSDGRFVLLAVGTWDNGPAATGPEADLDALGFYVLRDRVADTTTPLTFHLAPGGSRIAASPTQISDDGDRILISGSDADLYAFAGWDTAVYDRSEDRILKLPSLPAGVKRESATLSSDGQRAVVVSRLQSGTYKPTWWRGPLEGIASSVLDLPNASVSGISGDLSTIVYQRNLPEVRRPVYEPGRQDSAYLALIGVKVGEQPPRIVHESSFVESAPAAGTACTNATVRSRSTEFISSYIAADGARIGWTQHVLAASVEEKSVESRWADGHRTSKAYTGRYYSPVIDAFGSANEVLYDAPFTEGYDARLELVAGDTELIGSATPLQYINPGTHATRYTEATPFAGDPAPAPRPFSFGNEPVDSANHVAQVGWYTCPAAAADAPVGTFKDYAKIDVTSQPTALHSPGHVEIDLTPSSALRAAKSATVEISVFGIPYWTKTTSKSGYFTLPKPIFGIPIVLKVTVRPATAPGQAPPTPLVDRRSIFAGRYQ